MASIDTSTRFQFTAVRCVLCLAFAMGCGDDSAAPGEDAGVRDGGAVDATLPDATLEDGGVGEDADRTEDAGTDGGPDAPPPEVADYYIALDGDDANPGTESEPFATVARALEVVGPGDLVYLREGVYRALVELTVDGTEEAPIRWEGHPGEAVIFRGPGRGGEPHAEQIRISGDWNVVRHVTVEDSSGPGIRVFADHAWIDDATLRECGTTGINFWTNTGGRVSNSYIFASYNQFGADGAPADGGGADGISFAHCEGGLITRTIAFGNSDDGYDFWGSNNTRIEGSYAVGNGINRWDGAGFEGDGNGFKMGNCDSRGNSGSRNVSWGHPRRGFDSNCAQETSIDHGISFDDRVGFHNRHANNPWNNNASFNSDRATAEMMDTPRRNSWDLDIEPVAADFENVTPPALTGEETAAEALALVEASRFLHPAAGSALLDQGEDLGDPFEGSAPDLGAFEREE